MKDKSLVLLICLTSLSTINVSAEVYKWTDDKGQVHYTQYPAPKGMKVEPLATRSSVLKQRTGEKSTALASDQDVVQDEASEVTVSYREKLNVFCKKQKKNLKTLSSSKPVAWEEDGDTHLLNKQDRAEKVEEIKDSLDKNCSE